MNFKRTVILILCLLIIPVFSNLSPAAAAQNPQNTAAQETAASRGTSSAAAEASPAGNPAEADAPQLNSILITRYNRLTLHWTYAAAADGYAVYRRTASGNYSRLAFVGGGSSSSYTDKAFICNTRYYYIVRPYTLVSGEKVIETASNELSQISLYTGLQKVNNFLYYFNSAHKCFRKVNGNRKMVCVTYDDGPSVNTPTILKTLKKYNGRATFYVVGNRVKYYRSAVRAANALGCEIDSHTYTHATLTALSTAGIKSQVRKTDKAIYKVIKKYPVTLRPPGGAFNSRVKKAVNKPLIYWSLDTEDWRTRNSRSTISAVLNHTRDGEIILMHDLYPQTAKASKTIIPRLTKKGYQLVTIKEMSLLRKNIKRGHIYFSFRK